MFLCKSMQLTQLESLGEFKTLHQLNTRHRQAEGLGNGYWGLQIPAPSRTICFPGVGGGGGGSVLQIVAAGLAPSLILFPQTRNFALFVSLTPGV